MRCRVCLIKQFKRWSYSRSNLLTVTLPHDYFGSTQSMIKYKIWLLLRHVWRWMGSVIVVISRQMSMKHVSFEGKQSHLNPPLEAYLICPWDVCTHATLTKLSKVAYYERLKNSWLLLAESEGRSQNWPRARRTAGSKQALCWLCLHSLQSKMHIKDFPNCVSDAQVFWPEVAYIWLISFHMKQHAHWPLS